MAIRTTDPATRNQLAYALLLIREHYRHGGQGWMAYDRAFRQQAASDPSLRCNNQDYRLLRFLVSEQARVHFAPCAGSVTTPVLNVPWLISTHQCRLDPQQPETKVLGAAQQHLTCASLGTRGHAPTQVGDSI